MGDILQLSPWLCNQRLQQEVVIDVDNTDFQVILLSDIVIDEKVGDDHREAQDIAKLWHFPEQDCNEWHKKSKLHVKLQGPGLLVASTVWGHVHAEVANHEESLLPGGRASGHIDVSIVGDRTLHDSRSECPDNRPHGVVDRRESHELPEIDLDDVSKGEQVVACVHDLEASVSNKESADE